MQEFKNKNDYSIIMFDQDNFCLGKMEYVQSLLYSSQWLTNSSKFASWHYINVYVRRSGRYIGRFYKGNYIPNKPI